MKKKNKPSFRLQEKLTAAYLAALLGVYLLYPGLGGYMTITTQKWHCYVLLTLAYLVSMLLLPLELAAVGEKDTVTWRDIGQRIAFPQKMVLAYWFFSGVSTLLAVDRSTAFWGSGRCEGFLAITLYCGSFPLISIYGKPKRWMLWVFGAAMSLCCILALIQLAGYNPLRLYPEGMTYFDAYKRYAGEFLGTFGNVDILSAAFCAAIPCFWIAVVTLKGKERYFLLLPLALCLLALLCYLAALVSAAVYWVKSAAHDSVAAICGGAVLGYCIQAFFGISSPIAAPLLWVALGLLCGCKGHEKEEEN